jgi:prevent-host-death family protein
VFAKPVANPPEALAELLELVDRGERVVIANAAGRPVAVLMPFALAIELERLREDLEDAAAVAEAMAEQEASGEAPMPHAEVVASQGLAL